MSIRKIKSNGTADMRGAKIKHGLTKHPLYQIWSSMKRRCYCKKDRAYKWYGGAGVTICDEWLKDFVCFYNWAMSHGYSFGLSIERNENKKGYNPDNCKWIPRKDQPKNRSYCYKIKYLGAVKSLADWCRYLDLDYMLIYQRIAVGWAFEDAISKVSLRGNKKLST